MNEDRNIKEETFKSWNPMKADYNNKQFNQYDIGPFAHMETGQTGHAQKNVDGEKFQPYLVFKNVPEEWNKKSVNNICSRHGNVLSVRTSQKNNYFFVELANVADMDAVYRGLEKNPYGIQVDVGKQKTKPMDPSSASSNMGNKFRTNKITPNSRTFRETSKNPERPQLQHDPIVTSNDYADKENLLQLNDPKRHFLIEKDVHAIQLAGIQKPYVTLHGHTQYNYRAGRAFIEMPDKAKVFIEKKISQSVGHYDAEMGNYQNTKINIAEAKNIRKCSYCRRDCDLFCSLCCAYFCGLECQRKAWPKHRYTCGKPTQLQLSETTSNASTNASSNAANTSNASTNTTTDASTRTTIISLSSAASSSSQCNGRSAISQGKTTTQRNYPIEYRMPCSGSLVTLTAITKTNVVFIRSKTYGNNLHFFKTISDIQAAGPKLKPILKLPKLGAIVITKFNDIYGRAMVLNVANPQQIKIVFIDYGNLDNRPLTELYEAPQHFVDLPRFATPVMLKDVPDCYMTDSIREFMFSYLEAIDMEVKYNANADFDKEKGVLLVELIDEGTHQNFNKIIVRMSQPEEPSDILNYEYLERLVLPDGDNIELLVMDNSSLNIGCITCTTKPFALETQMFQKELQRYAESLPEQCYAPRVGELCIAKYACDKKWYRGRCIELVGDGYPTIVFIDYGNFINLDIKYIRRYPKEFNFPIYAGDCEIKGIPESCSPALVARLEQLIPQGSTIVCDHVAVDEDKFHTITLSKVTRALVAEGLLEEKKE